MNPFESGLRKVIPAVLVYVTREVARGADAGEEILMIHRNGRPGDYHSGKWNGLGGKCELDESPLEAAKRELFEESGLDLPMEAFQPLGTIQFPNFKAHKNEDWMVFVFRAELAEANARLKPCDEGELHWVPAKDLLTLNLWAGDRHFIPQVVAAKPFVGTIWYQGEKVIKHWIQEV